jgi:hypothetical protein
MLHKYFSFLFLRRLTIALMVYLVGFNANAQWKLNEGFEGGTIPSSWTIHDANGDNILWRAFEHANAHTGNWFAFVDCYTNNGNDWLVTPQLLVDEGDILTFYTRAWFGTEDLNVMLSTSGTAIADFSVTLEAISGIGSTWTQYTYDLSAYDGQSIHLAFHWVQDTYGILVDDVMVGQPEPVDAGMHSIDSPSKYQMIDNEIIPVATIKNYGFSDIVGDIPVSCEIRLGETIVYESSATFSGTLAVGETAVVEFAGWLPEVTGVYSVTMFTELEGDNNDANDLMSKIFEVVEHVGIGGPDAQGYRWISSHVDGGPVYDWIDISETGTSAIMYGVDSFHGDDNFSEPIPIGFDFPFYGIGQSTYHVDINGELLFGSDNTWYKPFPNHGWDNDGNPFNYHKPLPGYDEMPNLVAVFWDDLIADEGTGDVYFETFGEAPDRYHVIQWHNLRFVAGNGGTPTLQFQVILHENGDIVMQYKNVANGQSGSNIPHDNGQFATIGIQNQTADAGLSYLRPDVTGNQYFGPIPPGNLVQNESAVKFYVGEDTFPPIFTHKEVWNTFEQHMTLEATFTDVSGIASDTLYYNTGNGWQGVTHSGFESPNKFIYELTDLPLGAAIEYYFAANDNAGNRGVYTKEEGLNFSFSILPTADTRVLLASPGTRVGFSDWQSHEYEKYVMALNDAGVSFDFYNWAAFDSYRFPEQYDIIIGYSPNAVHNNTHDTLALALIEFMDLGTEANPKNVFMASDNMPSAAHPLPNHRPLRKLYTAYFRGAYDPQPNPPSYGGGDGIGGPNINGYSHGSIIGMANSPIGTEGEEISVYSNTPDVIYPRMAPDNYHDEIMNPHIIPGESFQFHGGPHNGNAYSQGRAAAIWLDNLVYKSFFISFDISQFTNDNDIITMIGEALEWFGIDDPVNYVVTAVAEPEEGGSIEGAGTYPEDTVVELIAIPAEGYDFVEWTENGDVVSTDAEYSFTITGDRSLVAHFQIQEFEVTVVAEPAEGGIVEGAGTYFYGQTAELKAIPAEHYQFINWEEEGVEVSGETEFAFNVTASRNLVANFELISSVRDISQTNGMKVFPNPASHNIQVELNDHFDQLRIYNITGVLVYEKTIDGTGLVSVDISGLVPGIYIVRATAANGTFALERLMINN